ncbi:MAG: hypothetical protein LBR00_07320, partial [Clostridiales Family XIII bacterium]|nr:hypothetical protein [Clostridiales Family XIII bacterium]
MAENNGTLAESRPPMRGLVAVASWLCCVVVCGLALDSVLRTSAILDGEVTSYLWDRPWWHALLFVVVVAGMWAAKNRGQRPSAPAVTPWQMYAAALLCAAILFALGLVFVLTAQVYPAADQLFTLEAGRALASGDASPLAAPGYLDLYPNQTGLAVYFAMLHGLFGADDWLAAQIVNAVSLAVVPILLAQITFSVFRSRRTAAVCAVLFTICTPLFFYTAFVYGTLTGLALALGAILLLLRFFAEPQIGIAVACAVCIALAILLRQNYLIFLVGMALCAAYYLWTRRGDRTGFALRAALLVVLLAVFLVPFGARQAVADATGMPASGGVPAAAFTAMGMQEGYGAPGWWNDYNKATYIRSGYDTDATRAAAKAEIADRAAAFRENPGDALRFYYLKSTSMWNNPTFQSFWILDNAPDNRLSDTAAGRGLLPGGALRAVLTGAQNLAQTFILLCAAWFF